MIQGRSRSLVLVNRGRLRLNRAALQNAVFPSATLAEFYRFALLLTGRAAVAELVLSAALAEAGTQLDQMRGESRRLAWLAQRIRARCLQSNEQNPARLVPRLLREPQRPGEPIELLGIEAYILAEHFHSLAEPGRSALALFYLDLFTPEEIAKLLQLELEELGAALTDARTRLQDSLRGAMAQPS
jgi:DNA-directed RNA polymerase specialized sigma24 family protein